MMNCQWQCWFIAETSARMDISKGPHEQHIPVAADTWAPQPKLHGRQPRQHLKWSTRCPAHRASRRRSSVNSCSRSRPQEAKSQYCRGGGGLASEVSLSDLPPGAALLSKGAWPMLPERGGELTACTESLSCFKCFHLLGRFLHKHRNLPCLDSYHQF